MSATLVPQPSREKECGGGTSELRPNRMFFRVILRNSDRLLHKSVASSALWRFPALRLLRLLRYLFHEKYGTLQSERVRVRISPRRIPGSGRVQTSVFFPARALTERRNGALRGVRCRPLYPRLQLRNAPDPAEFSPRLHFRAPPSHRIHSDPPLRG